MNEAREYTVTVLTEGSRYEVSKLGKTPRVVSASSIEQAMLEFDKSPANEGFRTAEQSGYNVGWSSKSFKNPFRLGTDLNKRWQQGFERGVAARKKESK